MSLPIGLQLYSIKDETGKQGAKWLIVEQEHFQRPCLESVKICYENLRKLVESGC